jgi:integral membrane protein (TIGR01906 family)
MRTRINAVLTPIWLLALSILVTIYLAWGFYYFDIDWMHLMDYVIIGKTELWHNFNVLMQYLTFPWVGHLAMPDFPSSESGLKHFHDVKWLFHLVQGLVILLAYPAATSLWRNVKKGTFGLYRRLYMSLAILPVLIGVVGLFLGFDDFLVTDVNNIAHRPF